MTEKKENILQAALELFSEYGYASTSTSKVAKTAGVSEGLIFRHFENKEGLLKAVILMGLERIEPAVAPIMMETDPEKVLSHVLEIPGKLVLNEGEFWRLIYSIKYQYVGIYQSMETDKIFEPIISKVTAALDELGWGNPEMEAQYLLVVTEGLMGMALKEGIEQIKPMIDFIKNKYI